MQDTLNIRWLLRQEGEAATGSAVFDFSNRDFLGFATTKPVELRWEAAPAGDAVRLHLWLKAEISGACVRCLEEFSTIQEIEKTYDIRMEDLEGEFPEYPAMLDGNLDLEEMAYGELVLEVSPILLCREDCEGLCSRCGQPKAHCGCAKGDTMDPRWQALRAAWNEEEGEAAPAQARRKK
ncbi:DUF177 domain-containing protein [Clostridia bacterium OttesenSCG-928-O13]|nr:DUF177 domain-containing protein [Clostridia bacterium OttesenSCG-928-O13]